ncbi:MAG: sugar transferase [Ancrocorticia sp.]
MTDLVIVSVVVLGAQFMRFGTEFGNVSLLHLESVNIRLTYTVLSIILIIGWMSALSLLGARDHRIVGSGLTEYKSVADATIRLFGTVAIIDLLLKLDLSRGYLLISFPVGLALLLLSRWLWRQWLGAMRSKGQCLYRAVIVGESFKSRHVANQINRDRSAGFAIVGIATDSIGGVASAEEPIFFTDFSSQSVIAVVDDLGADSIILASGDKPGPQGLREIGWAAEERGLELVVAPALTDIAGPRIHTRPVAGLPLIHIDYPEISGLNYWVKRTFDVVGSALLIAILSPVLALVALTIKVTSPGPVFFAHERIGQDGRPFRMLKFRSMVVNADAQLKKLLEEQGTADKPLFKVENDPRITPIGHFIRRYSIDELPQLFNSLMGSMSLVGPRPQVAGEVALYDDTAFRRLMVKPGLTGLWQVSGRSDLSWEDAIRLDLYYVENWSLTGDLMILLKTFRAVLKSDGAY